MAAPGTTTSRPSRALLASVCAHRKGVERSSSPAQQRHRALREVRRSIRSQSPDRATPRCVAVHDSGRAGAPAKSALTGKQRPLRRRPSRCRSQAERPPDPRDGNKRDAVTRRHRRRWPELVRRDHVARAAARVPRARRATKAGVTRQRRESPPRRQNRASVLARSLLAVGSMQKS
jgi:hypothetical protein